MPIINFVFPEPDDELWIGLNDFRFQMYFEWSDGTPVTYAKWLRGEPTHANNRQEDCVVMKGKVKSCLTIDLILFIFLLLPWETSKWWPSFKTNPLQGPGISICACGLWKKLLITLQSMWTSKSFFFWESTFWFGYVWFFFCFESWWDT